MRVESNASTYKEARLTREPMCQLLHLFGGHAAFIAKKFRIQRLICLKDAKKPIA
jgi:hypothetical protein